MSDLPEPEINKFIVTKTLTIKELRDLTLSESSLPSELKEDFEKVIKLHEEKKKKNTEEEKDKVFSNANGTKDKARVEEDNTKQDNNEEDKNKGDINEEDYNEEDNPAEYNAEEDNIIKDTNEEDKGDNNEEDKNKGDDEKDEEKTSNSKQQTKPSSTSKPLQKIEGFSKCVTLCSKKHTLEKQVGKKAQEEIVISMAIKVGVGLIKNPKFLSLKGDLESITSNSDLMNAIKSWKQAFTDDDILPEKSNEFSFYGHMLLVNCHREQLTEKPVNMDLKKVVMHLYKFANAQKFNNYDNLQEFQKIIDPINSLYTICNKISWPFSSKVL